MKRAPKELLDALRGIAERNSGLYVENGAQELLALLEEWQPYDTENSSPGAAEFLEALATGKLVLLDNYNTYSEIDE